MKRHRSRVAAAARRGGEVDRVAEVRQGLDGVRPDKHIAVHIRKHRLEGVDLRVDRDRVPVGRLSGLREIRECSNRVHDDVRQADASLHEDIADAAAAAEVLPLVDDAHRIDRFRSTAVERR